MADREIKEITKSNERWIKIENKECTVSISSPYESDSIKDLVKEADKLVEKHSSTNKSNYIG